MQKRHQFIIRFGYRGDVFYGLQPQKDVPTAGAALRARLEDAAGCRAKRLCFSARTDRGVHAQRNVATCFFRDDVFSPEQFVAALHADERDDGLRQVRANACSKHVHARGSSRGKRYRFFIDAGTDAAPSAFAWRIGPPMNRARLEAAAAHLVGSHDFSAFRAAGCSASSAVKTLHRVRVRGPYPLPQGERFIIEYVGDGFLRKMVRLLTGLLVEVGTGWRPVDDVVSILACRERRHRVLLAPPGGLTLVEVGVAGDIEGLEPNALLLDELRALLERNPSALDPAE